MVRGWPEGLVTPPQNSAVCSSEVRLKELLAEGKFVMSCKHKLQPGITGCCCLIQCATQFNDQTELCTENNVPATCKNCNALGHGTSSILLVRSLYDQILQTVMCCIKGQTLLYCAAVWYCKQCTLYNVKSCCSVGVNCRGGLIIHVRESPPLLAPARSTTCTGQIYY